MDIPVTTLASIITLAHQQNGIRFQQSTQQLVNFANMIQYMAYNKDVDGFLEFEQRFVLGIDIFLETNSATYTPPANTDLGKVVNSSIAGNIGTLLNFATSNRINKWIIAPPDGTTGFTLADGEILTIVAGTGATGVSITGQSFNVSNGPYKMPSLSDGNPPFRKFVGVTQVTDDQLFEVPPNDGNNGIDDYGLLLNSLPGRNQNFPYRFNIEKQEVSLVTSTPPEITTTQMNFGAGGTVLNSSKLRWVWRSMLTYSFLNVSARSCVPVSPSAPPLILATDGLSEPS